MEFTRDRALLVERYTVGSDGFSLEIESDLHDSMWNVYCMHKDYGTKMFMFGIGMYRVNDSAASAIDEVAEMAYRSFIDEGWAESYYREMIGAELS